MLKQSVIVYVCTAALWGCVIEIHETEKSNSPYDHRSDVPSVGSSRTERHGGGSSKESCEEILPGDWKEKVQECVWTEQGDYEGLLCLEREDRRWYSNCRLGSCEAVPVNVHYMLTEDLGFDNIVKVEAFDNPSFRGQPVSVLEVTSFDASRAGTRSSDVIFLAPGDYYFRAYIARPDQATMPYEYQGMELVEDQPVGVFGALSDVTKAHIANAGKWSTASIDIYLDKLLRQVGGEEATKAHLRSKLSVVDGYDVPLGHKVLIQLFKTDDFNFEPLELFEIASENFRVSGRMGRTEFISPDLPEGKFFVRAFLDLSQNGYFDEGEPVYVYTKNGETAGVQMLKNRTELIEMQLK